jgi:hypothetical protein
MKVGFHDQSWLAAQRANANPQRFSAALKQLMDATNPYATHSEQSSEGETDCCICIGSIAPYQALFIAPCSHVFHFKCVAYLIAQSPMFQCPMCRQVANLTASVSSDDLTNGNKIEAPLPILLTELEEKENQGQPIPVIQPNSNAQRPKRPSLVERIGLGILKSSHVHSQPASEEPIAQQSSSEEPIAQQSSSEEQTSQAKTQKKRTFSMKLKSFVGVKSVQESSREGSPHVPRTQHLHSAPGEHQHQNERAHDLPQDRNQSNEPTPESNSVSPGH